MSSSPTLSPAPPLCHDYFQTTTPSPLHIILDSDFLNYEEDLNLYDLLPDSDSDNKFEFSLPVISLNEFVSWSHASSSHVSSPCEFKSFSSIPFLITRLTIYPGPPRGGQRRRQSSVLPSASRCAATKTHPSSIHVSLAIELLATSPDTSPTTELADYTPVMSGLVDILNQVQRKLNNLSTARPQLIPGHSPVAAGPLLNCTQALNETELQPTLVFALVGTDLQPTLVYVAVAADMLPSHGHNRGNTLPGEPYSRCGSNRPATKPSSRCGGNRPAGTPRPHRGGDRLPGGQRPRYGSNRLTAKPRSRHGGDRLSAEPSSHRGGNRAAAEARPHFVGNRSSAT
ncbi:uncharacterized protein LOC133496065 isoform X2 [Syngnathoides biaculeatus]|nr:uncharacterized protein LOC133496065 isoform X2 [Syngnathoides biaculeatus]